MAIAIPALVPAVAKTAQVVGGAVAVAKVASDSGVPAEMAEAAVSGDVATMADFVIDGSEFAAGILKGRGDLSVPDALEKNPSWWTALPRGVARQVGGLVQNVKNMMSMGLRSGEIMANLSGFAKYKLLGDPIIKSLTAQLEKYTGISQEQWPNKFFPLLDAMMTFMQQGPEEASRIMLAVMYAKGDLKKVLFNSYDELFPLDPDYPELHRMYVDLADEVALNTGDSAPLMVMGTSVLDVERSNDIMRSVIEAVNAGASVCGSVRAFQNFWRAVHTLDPEGWHLIERSFLTDKTGKPRDLARIPNF